MFTVAFRPIRKTEYVQDSSAAIFRIDLQHLEIAAKKQAVRGP